MSKADRIYCVCFTKPVTVSSLLILPYFYSSFLSPDYLYLTKSYRCKNTYRLFKTKNVNESFQPVGVLHVVQRSVASNAASSKHVNTREKCLNFSTFPNLIFLKCTENIKPPTSFNLAQCKRQQL